MHTFDVDKAAGGLLQFTLILMFLLGIGTGCLAAYRQKSEIAGLAVGFLTAAAVFVSGVFGGGLLLARAERNQEDHEATLPECRSTSASETR